MKKVRWLISYDGTDFSGFQAQQGQRTVQGVLEEVLFPVTGEEIQIHGSGRTDAGVHAIGQVCHFVTNSPIPPERYPSILRHRLPRDILLRESCEVPFDFHARKSVYWKTYCYHVDMALSPHIFRRRFYTHVPGPLNISKMQQAADFLLGTHDFTSFCSTKAQVKSRVRTIFCCSIEAEAEQLRIKVTGSGFLYHMVRIIAGTLIDVGRGKIAVDQIPLILAAQDRTLAGPTAPPEGLTLMEVGYMPWKDEGAS